MSILSSVLDLRELRAVHQVEEVAVVGAFIPDGCGARPTVPLSSEPMLAELLCYDGVVLFSSHVNDADIDLLRECERHVVNVSLYGRGVRPCGHKVDSAVVL